jgi:excisionase family DNA binding protein
MNSVAVITEEQLEALVRRATEPLRVELERIRGDRGGELVSLAEAARRLGRDIRTIQRWVKNGTMPVELVGGARLVRLPHGTPQR